MISEQFIIEYLAETSSIKTELMNIERLNAELANSIGKDLAQSFTVVGDTLKKISRPQSFKIPIEGTDKLQELQGTIQTFETTLKGADNQLYKFTRTFGVANGQSYALGQSITLLKNNISGLEGASSQLQTQFGNLTDINAKFSAELTNFGNANKFLGTSLNQMSDSGSKVTKIFETASGKFVALTETTTRSADGIQIVNRSVKELSASQLQNISTIEGLNKSTRGLGDNFATLAKRALLTIPVWFAIRQSISSVFRLFRDGIKNIEDFDRALQKLGRNLEATEPTFTGNLTAIKKEIEDFSVKSGVSVEEITNAIQKFATVGFDLKTSLVGGIEATKLAVVLFGDASDTANGFARALRVLTENIDTAEGKQTAIGEALALTDKLWQTNAFEIDEFRSNLEKFAGTATIANLSIQETFALLATLSTGGMVGQAGNLLRTTLLKALSDIEGITQKLQLNFDPNKQSTLQFILALIEKLKTLKTTENVPAELADVISELFSVRGSQTISSLTALEKTLKDNLALTGNVKELNNSFEKQAETINRLAERSRNLSKEFQKAFVTGFLGAGTYENILKGLINTKEGLLKITDKLASSIRNLLIVAGVGGANLLLSRISAVNLAFLTTGQILAGLNYIALFQAIQLISDVKKGLDEENKVLKETDAIFKNIFDSIDKGLQGKLNFDELETLIAKLEVFGAKQLKINPQAYERLLELLKDSAKEQQKIVEGQKQAEAIAKKTEESFVKRQKIIEVVVANELEILKIQGASNSQLLQAEQHLNKRYNIEGDVFKLLETQLQKQRELNKEKELQNQLSSRTLKLFDIAKTEGVDVAQRIGEVLRGQTPFETFIRQGGKAVEVFKKEFSDIFKEQQALQFFKGEIVTEEPTLRGGTLVPVALEDETLINGVSNLVTATNLQIAQSSAFIQSLSSLTTPITDNKSALERNTASLDSLIQAYNLGVELRGEQAQRFVTSQAVEKRIFEIKVDVDGKQFQFTGTPEAIQTLAGRVSNEVAKLVESKLVNDMNTNNSAPISKATDNRIQKF